MGPIDRHRLVTDGSSVVIVPGASYKPATAVYLWREGALVTVADTSTSIPGGGGFFTGLGGLTIDGGDVVFQATGADRSGLYAWRAGSLSVRVDTSTIAPDGRPFASFQSLQIRQTRGALAFFASTDQTDAEYILADGLAQVATTKSSFPGGPSRFARFQWACPDGEDVALFGFGSGLGPTYGMYGRIAGELKTFATLDTIVPGGTKTFDGFDAPDMFAKRAKFLGLWADGGLHSAIFEHHGGVLESRIDESTPVPGGSGTFTDIGLSGGTAYSQGRAAFIGGNDSVTGLFVEIAGSLRLATRLDEPLGGRDIDLMNIENGGFDRGSIALWVRFTDASESVYLATLCTADANGDGRLNINDFIAFQSEFRKGTSAADCNGDFKLTINDFICFQAAFRAGCG